MDSDSCFWILILFFGGLAFDFAWFLMKIGYGSSPEMAGMFQAPGAQGQASFESILESQEKSAKVCVWRGGLQAGHENTLGVVREGMKVPGEL
jgi:hypothetical protein